MGIDGWVLNVTTEKNKLAPSQLSVDVVFDKKYGVDKLWSEYLFLSEMTKTESKLFKRDSSKMSYPLSIQTVNRSRILEVLNPTTGEVYKSDKFMEKNFKEKYNKEESFRKLFDYAVDIAVRERIVNYLFKYEESVQQEPESQDSQESIESIES